MKRKSKSPKTDGVKKVENVDSKNLPKKRHEPGTARCLILDGMNLAYQAYYAYHNLSHKGKSTSILFGMSQIISGLIKMHRPVKLIICWDGYRSKRRLKKLPGYKSHREEGRDKEKHGKFLKEIKTCRKLFSYMGIPQAHNEKLEGDDMIYWVNKKMQLIYPTLIVSADKDFKQLINYDVSLYHPRSKEVSGVFAFSASNAGIAVSQYRDYMILQGDKSDDIPGYPGIGPVRAGKLLKDFGSISNYLKSKEDFPGLTDKEGLKKLYKRNRFLMDLPYYNEKYHTDKDITYFRGKSSPAFNDAKYRRICLKYNLKTMLSDTFTKTFKNIING